MSKIKFGGSGPGVQTQDGCSVEFYRLLKPMDEPELIAQHAPKNGSILELGCSVGRITHPLVDLGYSVTAVDNSADMLAYVKGAKAVCSDIEILDLNHRYDAVLLMSHMINIPDKEIRLKLLETCQRHLKQSGLVVIQNHPFDLADRLKLGFISQSDGMETFVDELDIDDSLITMTIRWEKNENTWTQRFTTRILSQAQIEENLGAVGLLFDKWLNRTETIFSAKLP